MAPIQETATGFQLGGASGYTPIMAHDHAHTGHADPHSHGIWTHGHVFLGHGHDRSEARAKLAALVTAVFMVVEIGAGLSSSISVQR